MCETGDSDDIRLTGRCPNNFWQCHLAHSEPASKSKQIFQERFLICCFAATGAVQLCSGNSGTAYCRTYQNIYLLQADPVRNTKHVYDCRCTHLDHKKIWIRIQRAHQKLITHSSESSSSNPYGVLSQTVWEMPDRRSPVFAHSFENVTWLVERERRDTSRLFE